MDTKYFQQALDEWMDADPMVRRNLRVSELRPAELSSVLRHAQQLKLEDQEQAA